MASNAKNLAEYLNNQTTSATADIADGSITTAKLADDAVTVAKVGAGAIDATALASNAVTSAKVADGAVTQAKTSGVGRGKNVIINGAMQISQRRTSSSNVGNQYVLDRFAVYKQNTGSTYTCSQSSVTDLAGFANALKMDCTTADTSLAANEQVYIVTKLEGQDCQRFAKGHGSDALTSTLSFYVKTNKTGVYTVRIFDRDNSRNVSGSYTVANANWNRYSITFPADASGKLDDDNASSLELFFHLVNGSDTTAGSLATTWGSSADAGSATGQVNFADSTANNWEISGIQLEVGSQATDFDHNSFAEELRLCQRFYHRAGGSNYANIFGVGGIANTTGSWFGLGYVPVPMRAGPTLIQSGGTPRIQNGQAGYNASSISMSLQSTNGTGLSAGCNASGLTLYRWHNMDAGASAALFELDAEL